MAFGFLKNLVDRFSGRPVDWDELEEALIRSDIGVPMTLKINGDMLTVNVAAGNDPQGAAEVWLVPITKKVPVAIGRGENQGHTLTYNNVVRRWVSLGKWNGDAQTYNVSIKDFQNGEIDSVTVIIQNSNSGSPGVMLGAASAMLLPKN